MAGVAKHYLDNGQGMMQTLDCGVSSRKRPVPDPEQWRREPSGPRRCQAAASCCKHLLKRREHPRQAERSQAPQSTDEALLIDGSNLIEHNAARAVAEAAWNAEGVGARPRRE